MKGLPGNAGSETAPGPGKSYAVSTSELKVNGIQKMLISVAGAPGPPVVRAPDGDPVSMIVRAMFDGAPD